MECKKQFFSRKDDIDDYCCRDDGQPCAYLGTEWRCPHHPDHWGFSDKPVDLCPICGSDKLRTTASRVRPKGQRWRRKRCECCGARFSTLEVVIYDRDEERSDDT